MEDSFRDIVEQAQKGDIQAFEKIYRALSSFVYTLALRVTNNAEEAEEVTQDVFLKIHHNLNSFQFRSAFKTWVYRIAVNTALNASKRFSRQMRARVDLDDVIETQVAATDLQDEPGRQDELKFQKQRLESLLTELNPKQRMCITLREINGLSYEEIAKVMKININTVRSRLKRAREALLGKLK